MDGLYFPAKEDVELNHEDEYLERIEIKEEPEDLEEIEIKKEGENSEVGMTTRTKCKRSPSSTHFHAVTHKTKKLKPHTQEMHQDSLEEGKSSCTLLLIRVGKNHD